MNAAYRRFVSSSRSWAWARARFLASSVLGDCSRARARARICRASRIPSSVAMSISVNCLRMWFSSALWVRMASN
jgi:hypothetical protein